MQPDITAEHGPQIAVELPDRVYVSSVLGMPARPRTASRTRRPRHFRPSRWLRTASARAKHWLMTAIDKELDYRDILDGVRAKERRATAREIAAAIRSARPGPHGNCAGPARCPQCAVAASVDVLARTAWLTGEPQARPES